MELSKEEIKERNVIAASIRFYAEEQGNTRKYRLMAVVSILIAIALCTYMYIDAGACFKNYKKGIILSLFSGVALMWGYYTWVHMKMNKYLTPYVDREAMNKRIEELGGLDSAPKGQSSPIKKLVLWLVIAAVMLSIFNQLQL